MLSVNTSALILCKYYFLKLELIANVDVCIPLFLDLSRNTKWHIFVFFVEFQRNTSDSIFLICYRINMRIFCILKFQVASNIKLIAVTDKLIFRIYCDDHDI